MNKIDTTLIATRDEHKVRVLSLGAAPAHPLSRTMICALHEQIQLATEDSKINVIVLEGPGHIFCAGHDLKEIGRHRADSDLGRNYLQQLFTECSALMQDITLSPKPTIAMVDGIATAGGLQLAAACDLIFASTRATFCLPGVKNGGFCTTPAVAVSRNLSRKHMMELALSGDAFDVEWALAAGLINRVFPSDQLTAATMEFAQQIAGYHPTAIADGKRMLHAQLEMPLDRAYAEATEVMIGHFMDPVRIAEEKNR
ncbi:2,3-dehydroadipyl-CoA hydratase [Thalassovita gelatinovora]|uniref:2,3-dehydroadipyl-CoA hydratase n=1 Tax=Thalassovita gelatinovora TaxID=53501 RepID=A0A0P1FYZ0_THAGE|nr:enoyl-CoA hydratase-related protein [Thalassovita gelatinovora]QIZ79712.1 enoyl-CoA hydratase [Thalassovita gelatinovora]CUH66694.1 2,3-dehydroadipyl-CoA hydratase [Thalassovita gelatinovora]SEQ41099.1 Enoyl-CoA hydratase/carnithine racemase [Thalassovita gelatinovora]